MLQARHEGPLVVLKFLMEQKGMDFYAAMQMVLTHPEVAPWDMRGFLLLRNVLAVALDNPSLLMVTLVFHLFFCFLMLQCSCCVVRVWQVSLVIVASRN